MSIVAAAAATTARGFESHGSSSPYSAIDGRLSVTISTRGASSA